MKLNALLCVWNEEDIIESTVKHLFAQGCTDVFIVDNASTDKTVSIAKKAGAKLAARFSTKDFNEEKKIAHLNATVRSINERFLDDYIWWLYVDADEFPHIEGVTIAQYLSSIDVNIRAVHGFFYNHIPTHFPYFISGYHPADFQPVCTKRCSRGKIPLLRYEKGKKISFLLQVLMRQ